MVESVKAGGVGGSAPISRNASKTADLPFVVDDGASPLDQKARLSSVMGIGLENLLALQAVDEGAERRRRSTKRGTAMIAALRELQRGLLAGNDPRAALRVLNDLTPDDEASGDDELDAIVRAIALRARVEIALRARVEIALRARVEIAPRARVEVAPRARVEITPRTPVEVARRDRERG